MESTFNRDVRPFLELIDKLQQFGIQAEVSLPQIAVMGDQSSGKSSVLQSICGIPFPRGSGLVTRCPTQVIMSRAAPGTKWTGDIRINWDAKQPNCSGPVDSIEELCEKITILTDFVTGSKSTSFSEDCLIIRISSPDSPDLTIVDLPGIVRTSTQGQDFTVIAQVNQLIERYIAQSNTIILAVVPCNQDIATVDILERASIVDPTGSRTIGVLTKPDLIGPGSEEEVVSVLRNIKKPLKLGYFMLKNTSQKQLNDGITTQQAWQDEAQFFANHEIFKHYQSMNVFGRDHLVSSLTRLLVERIRLSLPEIQKDLTQILSQTTSELTQLGPELPKDCRELKSIVVRSISSYCEVLRHSSRGEYRDSCGMLAREHSLRLHFLLQQAFQSLQNNISALRPAYSSSSNAAIQSCFDRLGEDMKTQRGRELPGFVSSQVFAGFIMDLVEGWRGVVDDCRVEVIRCARDVSSRISASLMSGYPELHSLILKITSSLLESTSDHLDSQLEALLQREQDPFTSQEVLLQLVNNIRCSSFDSVLRSVLDEVGDKGDMLAVREMVKIRLGEWYMTRHGVNSTGNQQEMATLIQAYWDIASRRLVDNVCMCVENELSQHLMSELDSRCMLFGVALEDENIQELMCEDPAVSKKREALRARMDMIRRSLDAIQTACAKRS
mmetsp:Transcript_191/g.306  ORF Transcript_191/g.306 Transcript_191/m.306 type:complete len:668 (-) Transcript_191:94-2097(-)